MSDVRTPKVDSVVFNMAGKNNGELRYGGISKNRQIQPALIKRTKVFILSVSREKVKVQQIVLKTL